MPCDWARTSSEGLVYVQFITSVQTEIVNFEHTIAGWDIDIWQKYEDMLEFNIHTYDIHPHQSFQLYLNVRQLRIKYRTTNV